MVHTQLSHKCDISSIKYLPNQSLSRECPLGDAVCEDAQTSLVSVRPFGHLIAKGELEAPGSLFGLKIQSNQKDDI